ncbi:MAG: hypothetical protein ACX94B_09105 [Henriciella sp.]|nr:hypothetical protein [Hyphomonadaceae bacterium]
MKHLLKTGAALTLAATALTFSASAADAEAAWSLGDKNGKAFLHTVTEAGPSIALTCSERVGVQATVFLNGNSIDEAEIKSTSGLRTRKGSIETATTEEKDGDWLYLRPAKTLISTKGWQGKRIYNAAITGSPVTMTVSRLGEMTFELPGVDDQFKSFASSCEATS